MPPKRKPRAAAGRRAARHYLEDNPERQLSAEYVSQRQELIDDLERQVEERKQHIQQLADDAILALKQEHHVLKLSLPDSVLQMPLKEFKASGSVMNVLLQERGALPAVAEDQPPATAARIRRGQTLAPATVHRTAQKASAGPGLATQAIAETPLLQPSLPFTPAVPGTLQRVPQMGEVFYSANGSPLGVFDRDPATKQGVLSTALRGGQSTLQSVAPAAPPDAHRFATILKRPQAGSKTKAPVLDAIVLTTKDGTNVEVDCPEKLKQLPKNHQKEVTADLEAMAKRIDLLLGRGGTIATRRRRCDRSARERILHADLMPGVLAQHARAWANYACSTLLLTES